jgi:hypothetical protein
MASRLRRINWRLLGLHLLSLPFLVLGMQQLFLIWHIDYAIAITEARARFGDDFLIHFALPAGYKSVLELVLAMQMRDGMAILVALLIACILSGLIAWRRRESLLLPLLLFLGHFLYNISGLYAEPAVKSIVGFLHSGSLLAPNAKLRLATAGTLLLIVGLLPFFFSWQKTTTPQVQE